MVGASGDDSLRGGSGDDALEGGDGNDWLDGGAGDDVLRVGTGDDQVVFSIGGGRDVIYGTPTAARNGVLQLGQGITPANVTLRQVTDALGSDAGAIEISINGTGDAITIFGVIFGGELVNPYNPIQHVVFGDGTVWTIDEAKIAELFHGGTAASDRISGTNTPNVISGGDGNDSIYAWAGDDSVSGGSGADRLWAGDGADSVQGGADDDTVYGGSGADH